MNNRRSAAYFGLAPSSSGLGHHPLKVAARVRIPLGLLSCWSRGWNETSVSTLELGCGHVSFLSRPTSQPLTTTTAALKPNFVPDCAHDPVLAWWSWRLVFSNAVVEASSSAHEAAGSGHRLQRDLDDIVVSEGASSCRAVLESLRVQALQQRVGGFLHQHQVGTVGRRAAAGRERRTVEDGGVVAQSELGER